MLTGILRLDFGRSSDGVVVSEQLWRGLAFSLPRMLVVLVVIGLTTYLAAYFVAFQNSLPGRSDVHWLSPLLSYLLFIPPYGVPLLIFALLLVSGVRFDAGTATAWWASVAAMVIPAACLLVLQTVAIMKKNLAARYTVNWLALGLAPRRIKRLLYRNLFVELLPTWEKVVTGVLTGLMFAELIFGLPGIGVLAIRAIHLADVELLLGVVIVYVGLICLARFVSALVQEFCWRRGL
jgi:ABC-type dipeptide/oligopeptide/nickel transport system permease component